MQERLRPWPRNAASGWDADASGRRVLPEEAGGFAFGTVTKLSGSTLTVKGSFGSASHTTTVTISSKTALGRTLTVKPTAVTVKTCAFVNGTSADKGASVKATRVVLSPETSGKRTNGFRAPGR